MAIRKGGPVPGGRLTVVGERRVTLNVRVGESQLAEWRAAATMAGVSLSEFVRAAVENHAELARARFG